MDLLNSLAAFDLWDEDDPKVKQERDPYVCGCPECPTCGGGKVPLRVRKRDLLKAVARSDAVAVAGLLHCSTCWPDDSLKRPLKDIQTESVARAYAHAAPDFFFQKGNGAGALLLSAREGRAGAVRALLAAGVAADASAPGTEAKALPMACLHGHALCVEALLEKGADPNQRLMDGLTPLHLAAWAGDDECVGALLKWGAGVEAANDKGFTPLHCAAGQGEISCVKLLLEAGADPNARDEQGRSPLYSAVRPYFWFDFRENFHFIEEYRQMKHHDCLEELLKSGADVNIVDNEEVSPLFYAASEDAAMVMTVLLRHGVNIFYKTSRGETLLHRIASGCSENRLEALLDRGLDPNALDDDGNTPLHIAIRCNHPSIVGLLQMGADVSMRDHEGYTYLHRAAAKGQAQNVEELLRAGADPMWTVGEGVTALHLAAKTSTPECVEALLDRGADVNARTADGKTPLHFSAQTWSIWCADELLNRGADKWARDNAGWNTMHFAIAAGQMNIIKFLSEQGFSMDDRTNDGQTPMHLAASEMFPGNLLRFIREHHLDVNARDYVGRTPLHVAAHAGNEDNVRELLLAGADRAARDQVGESPADVAIINEVRRIILRWAIAG